MEISLFISSLLLLSPLALADGLYSKKSPVLQIDAKTYTKLIEKSNYTSIVEFYAPWCGHCKNLKPEYERVAKSLAGAAKVAAINCDDDANKGFCGSMGVTGFPTLKIVKPKKKGGKPIVSDYRGERTAQAIKEALEDKIPNHVTKLTDQNLDEWLSKSDKPKAVFFSEKGVISSMVKGIAIDFLGAMDVAQVKSTEAATVGRFMVESFPKAFFMGSGQHVPEPYQGELKKDSLLEFFGSTGLVVPNPEWPSPSLSSKAPKTKSDKKKDPLGQPTKVPKPRAASETLEDEGPPLESPKPIVQEDKPIEVPLSEGVNSEATEVRILVEEEQLRQACLTTKSTTCVLAIMSEAASGEANIMKGSNFIMEVENLAKATKNRRKFPIYGVPSNNKLGHSLLSSLGIEISSDISTVVAINAKRGWWTYFEDKELNMKQLADWVDSLKLGDFKRQKLPALDLKESVQAPEEAVKPESASEEQSEKAHEEL